MRPGGRFEAWPDLGCPGLHCAQDPNPAPSATQTRPGLGVASVLRAHHYVARGFTLLELMVVLVVLTIVSTAIMARAGLQTADSSFRRYTDDVLDTVVAARARAIDDQTRVFLTMRPTGVTLEWINPDTGVREHLWAHSEGNYGGGVISDLACNAGLYNGVVAPGETRSNSAVACLTDKQELLFLPDGSFRFDKAQNAPAGVTAVVLREINGQRMGTVIEVFPGGNVRSIDNVVF